MAKLTIKNFSCINYADIDTSIFTILIGPQASGKSVISKLVYFFQNAIIRIPEDIREEISYDEYQDSVCEFFREMFPEDAWGVGTFEINYSIGDILLSIKRVRPYAGRVSIDFKLEISSHLEKLFESSKAEFRKRLSEIEKRRGEHGIVYADLEVMAEIRDRFNKELEEISENGVPQSQLFIPAARSFFTSMAKVINAIQAFDPITKEFGQLFIALKERSGSTRRLRRGVNNRFMQQMIGGALINEKGKEFILTEDERKIPLNLISSGQQEMLPLLLAIEFLSARKIGKYQVTIEEPEAHLFPVAQNRLLNMLVGTTISENCIQSIILTTHSPYVLAKINNHILASQVAQKFGDDAERAVVNVMGSPNLLPPEAVTAYALDGGCAKDIVGQDGLIDGEYIDSVSADIGEEFEKLLDIEARYV